MTALELQDALVEEVKSILDGYLYKKVATEERVPINIYPQNIPISETDDEEAPIPYIIVRLSSGEDAGDADSFHTVRVLFIIGIWDDSSEAQGHRDVMNIIHKIYQRFYEDPRLQDKAIRTGAFHWAPQEDAYYPFFFGACSMDFAISAIRREDPFA